VDDPYSQLITYQLLFVQSGLSPFVISGFITLALLLLCSAFVSGAEIAFFSLKPNEIETLKEKPSRNNKIILELLQKPKNLLATILIANNMINIAIVIISSLMIDRLFDFGQRPWIEFLIQVIVVTFIILLLGEVTPKVYATRYGIKMASIMALPLFILEKIFQPLSYALINSTGFIEKRFKSKGHDISVDTISHAIEITNENTTSEEEKKILKGIVRFGTIEVKQIMKPRINVVAFDIDTKFDDLLYKIIEAGFSRVPIFRDNFDNIEGILFIKDLLPYVDEKEDFQWQKLIRPPFFVPENKKIDDLLREFQQKKIHMAIVVDEYGGTSGIITLEDIIEEIVGDINDEFDDDEIQYSKLDEYNYVFDGKILLNDMYRILKIDGESFDKARGEADTLAGFIIETQGKIPAKNEVFSFDNFTFKIEAADKRKIKTVKVTINKK
jgi:gliding motility-associated protein GldE